MTPTEFKNWQTFMRASRGLWTIDPVHDGVNRDLIAFRPDRRDASKGVFVKVDGPSIRAGRYTGAVPHMGEAEYNVLWGYTVLDGHRPDRHGSGKPTNAAAQLVFERLGVRFLIEAVAMGR